jgi:beta-phosphoglucomutase
VDLREITNFLFDFDGTLVDSSSLHAVAFCDALGGERPDLLAGFSYEPVKGLATHVAFSRMGVTDTSQLKRLVEAKQQRYREFLVQGRIGLLSGARETLQQSRTSGHRLFLVTSGSCVSVTLALVALGIKDMFEGVVTSDDVSRSKPDPEPYRFCLKKYGLDRAMSVAIEDAVSGVRAAHSAGLTVVGVHNAEISPDVDLFFEDLALFRAAIVRENKERCLS